MQSAVPLARKRTCVNEMWEQERNHTAPEKGIPVFPHHHQIGSTSTSDPSTSSRESTGNMIPSSKRKRSASVESGTHESPPAKRFATLSRGSSPVEDETSFEGPGLERSVPPTADDE
jgi:hypothetical protein